MDRDSLYLYRPIQAGELRLCRFFRDGDSLSATLVTYSADQQIPPYTALSYTWSSDGAIPTKSWTIRVEGQSLPALDSLKPFFQIAKSKGALLEETWWWIDSICIDQSSTSEKNKLVPGMRHVYQNAEKVIVWLGEQSHDSEDGINFIISLDQMRRTSELSKSMLVILQQDHYHPKWIALRNFFLRRWWSRIWTIQESVIPSSVSFWCGSRDFDRDAVIGALRIADECKSPEFKNSLAFYHGWNRRRAWLLYQDVNKSRNDLSLSLPALAAYFCNNEATDDRDRLYGLDALSNSHIFDINYSWDVDEVYLRFTQSFITQNKSLDIICFATIFGADLGSKTPSWVPDWRKRVQSLVIPLMVSQSANKDIGNLRGPSAINSKTPIQYSASGDRAAIYYFEGPKLFARGYVIDVIDGLAASQTTKLVQSSESHSTQCPSATCSQSQILRNVCRSLVLDRKDRYLRYAMPMDQFYDDFIHFSLFLRSDSTSIIPKEFQEWFERTRLLEIHGCSFENILHKVHQNDADRFRGSAPNQDEYIPENFFNRFYDVVVRMSLRLMTSCTGRIGMGPEKAKKGDLVCILFGCSVPVLLRPVANEDTFSFIGECFLDGCMAGETLGDPKYSERAFSII